VTAAFLLGPRGAEDGVFIAPPGVDALTATPEQLLLHVTSAVPQIAIRGTATGPFPQVVPHLLGYVPIAIPNVISTNLVDGTFGYVRPFDNSWAPWTVSFIPSAVNSIIVNQSGPALAVGYFIYNRRAP
jgi:hypothetical protein